MRYVQLLCILLFLSANFALAQFNKGNIILAGSTNSSLTIGSNGSTSNSGTFNFEYTKITFSPIAGYFVIDNLPVGVFIDLKYENLYNQEKSRTIEYGAFTRYYILDVNKFNPYLEGRLGFGNSITKYKYYNSEVSGSIFSGRVGAGCTYLFNKHVGLDLLLAYDYKKIKIEQSSEIGNPNNFTNKSNDFTLNLGLVVLLGKKE
ncbi:MAG: outer membrane beta-barrel protein [Bacteroidales bacterium]